MVPNHSDTQNLWSFEKVGAPHPRLFAKVANHIDESDHLGKFKPQELSNIILAYTKSEEPNQRLFEKIADHIVSHRNLVEFDPTRVNCYRIHGY